MVVCTYFLQGTCHFGSRCRNEHVYTSMYSYSRNDSELNEIRDVVISETESALNGKQWILSCFAPFREKQGIIIPGFIEDLSPEEVRLGFYDAKAQGALQRYVTLLSTKIEGATQKMQLLKSGAAEVTEFLSDLYNGNIDAYSNNPFCASNCYGQSSIFALPKETYQQSTGNVFLNNNDRIAEARRSIFQSRDAPQANGIFGERSSMSFSLGFPDKNNINIGRPILANTNVFGANPTFGNNYQPNSKEPVSDIIMSSDENSLANGNVGSNMQIQLNNNIFQYSQQTNDTNNPFLINRPQCSYGINNGCLNNGFGVSSASKSNGYLRDPISGQTKYTELNELTSSEKEEFANENFKLGSIPRRPPPKEMSLLEDITNFTP